MIKLHLDHDGHTFQYSAEAIEANCEVIGVYFDALNHPHAIKRESLYGDHICRDYYTEIGGLK